MNKVAVIGGGAAGLMAAAAAADAGASVTLIEKNEKVGKKLYITGKGRCNVTNACAKEDFFRNVVTNPKFLYSAVNMFGPDDLCRFFENAGLKLKTERGNRVFPVSDKSSDVIKTLKKECEQKGVKILLDTEVKSIEKCAWNGNVKETAGNSKETRYIPITADAVIIATGGLSYSSTGSTGDGYLFAEGLGHSIVDQMPSLVPIKVKERWVGRLEGLSLKNVSVTIKKEDSKKPLFEDFGEMLFTADGVSGPVILTASAVAGRSLAAGKDYRLYIDLKPALDEKQLDKRILKDFEEAKNKEFKNSLNRLLPSKMIPVIIDQCRIGPEERVNMISREQRAGLVKTIKNLTFTIDGPDSFDKAVITKGGVNVKQIDPKTMESKLAKNIYFAGEVLDVDAFTGGFNLQIAFSTGRAAGLAAAKEEYETDSNRWTCWCRKKHNS